MKFILLLLLSILYKNVLCLTTSIDDNNENLVTKPPGKCLGGSFDTTWGVNKLGVSSYDYNYVTGSFFYAKEEGKAMFVGLDGSTYIAGSSKTPTGTDGIIMKLNKEGLIDTTFGEKLKGKGVGFQRVPLSSGSDEINGIFLLKDSSIIVGGISIDEETGQGDFGFIALTKNGQMLTKFGSNGRNYVDFNGHDLLRGIVHDTTGARIIAGGSSIQTIEDNEGNFTAVSFIAVTAIKLGVDGFGYIDESFGTEGKVLFQVSESESVCSAIGIDLSQKIYLGGNVKSLTGTNALIVRLLSNGEIDTTFATNGIFQSNPSKVYSIVGIQILKNGEILSTGIISKTNFFNTMRLKNNGDIIWNKDTSGLNPSDITAVGSNRVCVVGTTNSKSMAISCLNAKTGIPDKTFGKSGLLILKIRDEFNAVMKQTDGKKILFVSNKIYVAGSGSNNVGDLVAIRLCP